LKDFVLTCKLFYACIKGQTKSIKLSTNKYHFDDFNTLLDEKTNILKNIIKKIQHTILFEQFKTFHITVKKNVGGLISYYEKKKIRKYIIPKNLLNYQPNKYIFLYKHEHDYIIDIKNNIFYTKKISNLDAIIQNDWYEDEDMNIIC
ncbi:38944_t:CDS:1, partial [Gigaspora margarita]